MYGPVKVWDHTMVAINQQDATVVVRKGKKSHAIDLAVCAENFQKEYGTANGNCVGDSIENKCVYLHTSGVKTVISFKRRYVCNLLGKKLFSGNRTQRFRQFQNHLTQLGFTTYDLT